MKAIFCNFAVLAVMALGACSTTTSSFEKPGVTEEQARQDAVACSNNDINLMTTCMHVKGYTATKSK